MALTPTERTAIIDGAISKLQTQAQAVVAAQAEVARLQALIDADPNAAEVTRLTAELEAASTARDAAIAELATVDADLVRLRDA